VLLWQTWAMLGPLVKPCEWFWAALEPELGIFGAILGPWAYIWEVVWGSWEPLGRPWLIIGLSRAYHGPSKSQIPMVCLLRQKCVNLRQSASNCVKWCGCSKLPRQIYRGGGEHLPMGHACMAHGGEIFPAGAGEIYLTR